MMGRGWIGWILPGLVAFALVGGWFGPTAALAGENRQIVAVMEIVDGSGRLTMKEVRTATNYLRARLTATGSFYVVDESRQAKALNKVIQKSKKDSYKLCRAKECQIPLGQELSADSILRTELLYLGGVFTLQAELIDLSKEAGVKAAMVELEGRSRRSPARALTPALKELVAQLDSTGPEPREMVREDEESGPETPEVAWLTRLGLDSNDAGYDEVRKKVVFLNVMGATPIVGINYEELVTPHVSAGVGFGGWPGFGLAAAAILRYYPSKEAGWRFFGEASLGYMNDNIATGGPEDPGSNMTPQVLLGYEHRRRFLVRIKAGVATILGENIFVPNIGVDLGYCH